MLAAEGKFLGISTGESLGMQLPVTLLYDYQSVAEIVEYIDGRITAVPIDGAAGSEDGGEPLAMSGRSNQQTVLPDAPSNLLKTLRYRSRPDDICIYIYIYVIGKSTHVWRFHMSCTLHFRSMDAFHNDLVLWIYKYRLHRA